MPAIDADLPKAHPGAEPAACDVVGKDARNQLRKSALLGRRNQGAQRQPAYALPSRGTSHVDRELCHSGIRRPGAVLGRPREAEDTGAVLDDDRGISIGSSAQQPLDHLGRSRLGLEGGRAVLDPLVVDLGDSGGIARLRQPGVRCRRHFLSLL